VSPVILVLCPARPPASPSAHSLVDSWQRSGQHYGVSSNRIKVERKRLEGERQQLNEERTRWEAKWNTNQSNLALLDRLSGEDGAEDAPMTLIKAGVEAMKALKRFTRSQMVDRIRADYPDLQFSDSSVVKPIRRAMASRNVRMVQAHQGNKAQAIYEWSDTPHE
jgi:hypothetical protein